MALPIEEKTGQTAFDTSLQRGELLFIKKMVMDNEDQDGKCNGLKLQ